MFDMSWGEVLVIGAVALIVIGPKDLPKALRAVGNVTGKVRRMAAEFQSQFNDAMREAELDEIRRQVESANQSVSGLNQTAFNSIQTAKDELKGAIEAPPVRAGEGAAPPPPGSDSVGAAPPSPPAATPASAAPEPAQTKSDKPGSAAA